MNSPISIAGDPDYDDENLSLARRAWLALARFRYFLLLVILPTALLSIYYYAIAADQYQSEAHFIVSANGETSPSSSSAFGALIGLSGASASQSQMMSVPDFLLSHSAVAALSKKVDLVAMFRRPEADTLSELLTPAPTPEKLLKYYRGKVDVHLDHDTGITTIKVRAFRPDDAYAIIQNLLRLGEAQVNAMNERSYRDGVSTAEQQLHEAEAHVSAVQSRLTSYRQMNRDLDPKTSGDTQIKLVSEINSRLAMARSQLATMRGLIRANSPQLIALQKQVRALDAEAKSQSSLLTSGSSNTAGTLGGYEDLQVRQEFAAKQYDAAAASLAKARENSLRQQLYLVRVVDANKPVKSEYPQRGKILLTTFLGLAIAYGIAWLIVAGVREHAA